ncbi:MAG: EpsG family protein [Sulfurospirillum sp.]|nr:EpsG family protein [Sulfurospirillum sp.]
MYYLALHFSTFIFIFLKQYFRDKNSLFIFTFVVVYFAMLLPSLRLDVGHDYYGYYDIFNSVKPLLSYSNFDDMFFYFSGIHGENGFLLIISIFKKLGLSFEFFIFFNACLNLAILTFVLIKFQKEFNINIFLSLFLYFSLFYFVSHFSQIRLGLVIVIFLLSIYFMIQKKMISYLLSILFGALFHKIILFALPLYFIRNLNIHTYFKSTVILMLGAILYKINILELLLSYISGYDAWIVTQLFHYSTMEKYLDNSLPLLSIIYFCVIYFVSLFFHKKYVSSDSRNEQSVSLLLLLFLLSIFINIAFWNIGIIGGRISTILFISVILLVPMIYKKIKSNNNKIIYLGLVLFYCFVQFYKSIYFENHGLLPYKTILGI